MNLKIFFLLCCVGSLHAGVYSQKSNFSLQRTDILVEDVLKELQETSGFRFFYQKGIFEKVGRISVTLQDASLQQVLDEVLVKKGFVYEIVNDVISIRKNAGQQSQGVKIHGQVMDMNRQPLPGVTVLIKGTQIGVSTDANGKFSMNVPEPKTVILVFSMVGMKTQEVAVGTKTELNVVMKEEANDLDEVVVIGYGSTTQRDLTGSVSRFDTRILEESSAPSIAHMLQGQIPGLSILVGDGSPGSSAKLEIRGASTMSGSSSPLIVVDNVPMSQDYDINLLNPEDIKSIDVLKGASSTAIYGSRATGGVVMITTKGGVRNQKAVIDYSYNFSNKSLVSDIRTLTTDEFKMLLMEATRNEAMAGGYDDISDYSLYKTFSDPAYFGEENTQWMKLLMQSANTQQHRLSIRGGGNAMSYNASFSYMDEAGVMKSTGFERYTYDMGFDADVNKYIKARMNVSGSFSKRDINNMAMSAACEGRPDVRAYNEDGSLYIHSYETSYAHIYSRNPIAELTENTNRDNGHYFRLSGGLDFKILPGLTFIAQYSYQQNKTENKSYSSSNTYDGSDGFKGTFNGKGSQQMYSSTSQELEGRLTFSRQFNSKHSLTAVAAATYSGEDTYRYKFTLTGYGDDNVQNGIWQGTEPSKYNWKDGDSRGSMMISFVGRAEYKYLNRYLLTVSARTDGSSKFSPDNRWGVFPAVAAGWVVSEEKFWKDNLPWLGFFKLKAGWGKTGNGWVGEYGWRTMFTNSDYEGRPAFVPDQIGNDKLKWEATQSWDLGFDFSMLKGQRLRGNFGVYKKKTDGLLYDLTMAPSSGVEQVKVNYACIENRGLEFNVGADIIRKQNWSWSADFNISRNLNKVTKIDADLVSIPGMSVIRETVIQEGKSLGLLYGYQTDGVFKNKAEIARYNALNSEHKYYQEKDNTNSITIPGDLKYVDQNGDGYVNRETNAIEDRVVLGCSRPKFEGGLSTRFSWKGLTMSIQTAFSYGAQKAWTAYGKQFQFNGAEPNNVLDLALNRWTPEMPDRNTPGMRLNKYQNDITDFVVFDASYWKIQNVNLDYRLPAHLVEKTKVFSDISVYVSSNNLYTLTSYPGPTPESWSMNSIVGGSLDYETYPQTRTFSFGVKVTIK